MLFISQIPIYDTFSQINNLSNIDTTATPKNISGITCDKTEHLIYHNHTKLVINNENASLIVPEGIGILPNECIFWLHTHDDTGIIHVESPFETSFSLGQFLQVWNTFDNSSIVNDILKQNIQVNASILLENQSVVLPSADILTIPLENNAIVTLHIENETNS
jgi:hypothetical protein